MLVGMTDKLITLMCRMSLNFVASNSRNIQGLPKPVRKLLAQNGLDFLQANSTFQGRRQNLTNSELIKMLSHV
jgi:hypothetical protein